MDLPANASKVLDEAGEQLPDPAVPGRRPLHRALVIAACALATIVAFAVYLRLAQTRAVNSDGSGNALQAWDMLHGNLLLHGWTLSDVSFYTTELPEYMLVELVRGLNQDVVHIAAALTYTLAVLFAALLAKGSSTGREALVRAGIAAGIMLAPQLDSGTNVLLSSPDHIGTSVPVMVVWLILDRARPRWYVPVVTALLLAWAQVADMLVLYVAVLPLAAVSALRVWRAVVTDRRQLSSQWYDIALGAGALAAAAAATLALYLIHAHSGFTVKPLGTQIAPVGTILGHNLRITGQGLLLLGGADFLGLRMSAGTLFTMLHVVGVALAAWAIGVTARRFVRDTDRVAQLLLAGIVINLAAYLASTKVNWLPSTREIALVLPFAAALAGRQLGPRLMSLKLVPVFLIVGAAYLAGLGLELSTPPAPPQNQQLTSWLEAQHLTNGLSGFWESSIVTLTSGGKVSVRLVSPDGGRLSAGGSETNAAWYDPARASANFVVLDPGSHAYPGFMLTKQVLATFGKPAQTYHVGPYTILVWNKNLLTNLRLPPAGVTPSTRRGAQRHAAGRQG